MLRKINLSAAGIVLISFFLPWVQVSCAGASGTLSGFDLARHQDALLWLVPILIIAVIGLTLLRGWKDKPGLTGMVSVASGAIAALLMNRERLRVADSVGVISAQLTGWFWLSLFSALAMLASGLGLLLRRGTTKN